MKYVWIIVAVILLVRIDVLFNLFDKATGKIKSQNTEVGPSEIAPQDDLISITDDQTLKQTPKMKFLAIMEDFSVNPDKQLHLQGMEFLRANPKLFGDKLDAQLEAALYRWSDLIIQKNAETYSFVVDLLGVLTGENSLMAKRFFSQAMDNDLPGFLSVYLKTKDVLCPIAGLMDNKIPDEEKIFELRSRGEALAAFLSQEKIDPIVRALAFNCQVALKAELDRLAPPPPPTELEGTPAAVAPAPETIAPPASPSP